MANEMNQRDIVLDIGTFAFIRDRTGGAIKIGTGPNTITPSQSDEPVRFNASSGRFEPCNLDQAVQLNVIAREGSYIVLENPAADQKQPRPEMKGVKADVALNIGSKIVIPGPWDYPLWPRQSAQVIDGHQLKSNQYLLCRVYNEQLAKENWAKAVVRRVATLQTEETDPEKLKALQEAATKKAEEDAADAASKLVVGQLFIVKGTEVSFYIPPSGIEVLKEGSSYVRDALTLERMEYCILVDENGRKRYERGPQVVFPTPTEKFFKSKDGEVKQHAIELNPLQAIHAKALVDFKDANGKEWKAGEEIWITGQDTKIFFPREELAFVKYDGKTKHFAVAVPEGEGRYVLDRMSGKIETIQGPTMLLPDARTHVVVRRVLSAQQCNLWYPGNTEVLAYNVGLEAAAAAAPTTRAGAISEGDIERNVKGAMRSMAMNKSLVSHYGSTVLGSAGETSRVSGDQKSMGDEFERQSGYTQPRTLTLNTKLQGAVGIDIWTGYAVQIVSKTGERQVVKGPTTRLLDYDETLEVLTFSTGKPKNTDAVKRDVYLRVENNKVSDVVQVETSDHVLVDVKLSYKINFTGDGTKWFSVENYVKFFCDHARSMLKGAVRKITVEEFYQNATDIIRDILLGTKSGDGKRAGLFFPENGMQMDDFEVLGVSIVDESIRKLLADAQILVVRTNVELAIAKRNLEVTEQKEELIRNEASAKAETQKAKDGIAVEQTKSALQVTLTKLAATLTELGEQQKNAEEQEALKDLAVNAGLARDRKADEQRLDIEGQEQAKRIELLNAEKDALVAKLTAFKDGYGEILSALADREVMVKLSETMNLLKLVDSSAKADELIQNIVGLKNLKGLIQNGANGTVSVQAAQGLGAQPKA